MKKIKERVIYKKYYIFDILYNTKNQILLKSLRKT
jgi:hypothetical protein